MKKKILAILLSATMLVGSTLSVSALEETVEGEGYIGLKEGTIPGDLISVIMPDDFYWFVNEKTDGKVQSPSHSIKNDSENANLVVTLQKFKQNDSITLPGELALNFTGDLRQQEPEIGKGIVGYEGDTPYSEVMAAGTTWTFGFDGTYTGKIPAQALQPTYKMILNFSLDSVNVE